MRILIIEHNPVNLIAKLRKFFSKLSINYISSHSSLDDFMLSSNIKINQIDFIVMNINFGKYSNAGINFLSKLSPEQFKKVILFGKNKPVEKQFGTKGVKHFVEGNFDGIISCINGKCLCEDMAEIRKFNSRNKKLVFVLCPPGEIEKWLYTRFCNTFRPNQVKFEIFSTEEDSSSLFFAMFRRNPMVFAYFLDRKIKNCNDTYEKVMLDYSNWVSDKDYLSPDFSNLFCKGIALTLNGFNFSDAIKRKHNYVKLSGYGYTRNFRSLIYSSLSFKPLPILKSNIKLLFEIEDPATKRKLINIASVNPPKPAKEKIMNTYYYDKSLQLQHARCCRYLSLIRCEFGNSAFEEIVKKCNLFV